MATTIYTYLHNDDLNGSRIISMDDCMCKLYNIIRDDSEFMKDFEKDLRVPALYILINKYDLKAYIGETDDFIKRIPDHLANKNFWTEVMVFIGTNEDTLSKTEVQYLEYLAIERAKFVDTYDLPHNIKPGKIPHMNVMQKGKTDKFFRHVQFLSKFVGCDIFKKNVQNSPYAPMISPPMQQTVSVLGIKPEDLAGRDKSIKLNGIVYPKSQLGYGVIKEYLKQYPKTPINELKSIFHIGLLGSWGRWNLIEDDLETANSLKDVDKKYRHLVKDQFVLTSGDGVKFVVCNQWDKVNILNLLQIAKEQGWIFEIITNNE